MRPKSYATSRNMTPLARQMRKIGTYNQIARFFERHETTVKRWATGDFRPSPAERFMIALIANNPELGGVIFRMWLDRKEGVFELRGLDCIALQLFETPEPATS